jgi:hypothetical protein
MLALQESSGFEVMKEDELYYINGGSIINASLSGSGSSPITWTETGSLTWTTKNGTVTATETISMTNGILSGSASITYTANKC